MSDLRPIAPAEKTGTDSPIETVDADGRGNGHPEGCQSVGVVLSGDELEQHIDDCQHLWLTAYERFQMHGLPADRDEALLHLHCMNEAILSRPAAVQAQRHAEFERMLDEGLDYFQVQGARDAAGLAERVD